MHPATERHSAGVGVRGATPEDIPRIVEIYNHEVTHGRSNYETRRHSINERLQWLEALLASQYPVLCATRGGRVVGFAALTPFHPLTGYRHTVTGSLYVDVAHRRSGVGASLSSALLSVARAKGFHTIIAGVNAENRACIELLRTVGFRRVGYFREIGQRNGDWQDDICLQVIL